MTKAEKVKLSVSVADDHLTRFGEVVARLRTAGLEIEETLEGVGVVTGLIDAKEVEAVRTTRGVAHVEQARVVQLSPPDEEVP
jgi:hypothetical protein